eukprot:scaffold4280_cov57-Cyclotella_meneghiniana.AAC.2
MRNFSSRSSGSIKLSSRFRRDSSLHTRAARASSTDFCASRPDFDLAGKAFQSRPHYIIQYILNETLGQSSSNGLDVQLGATTEVFTLRTLTIQPVLETLADKALSNPDHITSFNISSKRHWDSPAAMLGATTETFTLRTLKIQPVETLADKAFQSRPHQIIQYILNETLGQSSSNGLDVHVHLVQSIQG